MTEIHLPKLQNLKQITQTTSDKIIFNNKNVNSYQKSNMPS
jgi:hypothetical protein